MTVVDARGHRCPVPSLRLAKALETARPGDTIRLLATDPMARIDVPHMLADGPHRVLTVQDVESGLEITVETGAAPSD
ncbi:sulfurtransferase TusA family protein [Brevundimonas sp. A19_0]|uniref:sulfurtransferase TusA family protein n=1 Tax=Brevundimonas sp. A19_0 TaxID=2821087 RepID=UPI001ADCBD0A|nr:sulfurtransferase TusA family protein [Brevundimonas sp. A19_0]